MDEDDDELDEREAADEAEMDADELVEAADDEDVDDDDDEDEEEDEDELPRGGEDDGVDDDKSVTLLELVLPAFEIK